MRVEVCFLIDAGGTVLWTDRSSSATSLPDSTQRWRAIWRHRRVLAVIAHSHPGGPLDFSDEDRTTMEALDAALGRPLRYAVVTPRGLLYREPDGTDRIDEDEPPWVARLRAESGADDGGGHGDPEHHIPGAVGGCTHPAGRPDE